LFLAVQNLFPKLHDVTLARLLTEKVEKTVGSIDSAKA
jgi:hypothetical protein